LSGFAQTTGFNFAENEQSGLQQHYKTRVYNNPVTVISKAA